MQYVFIVTYGRSGSTLVQALLNAIDGYCIRGENGAIANHLAQAVGALERMKQKSHDNDLAPDTPWYGFANTQLEPFAQGLAEFFVEEILKPPEGTRVTGFKEIRYAHGDLSESEYDTTIEFLAQRFPNSRFIFNTRDGDEVSKSGWWATAKRTTPRSVRAMVKRCDERFARSCERLGTRAFLIDYSQYNRKPEGFLPLLKWLGEELSLERIEDVCSKNLTHVKGKHAATKLPLRYRVRKFLNR